MSVSLPLGSMNPLEAGSIVGLPPGSVIPVNVNGSIVPVKTVPAPAQRVIQTQTIQVPQQTVVRQSIAVPETTTTTTATTSVGSVPTPTLRTLAPKIVRNQLPPKYNTVTLPAKVVSTRLPPLGPPPTPANLSIPAEAPVTSIAVPAPTKTLVKSVAPAQTIVQSVTPVTPVAPVQSVVVPTTSVVKSIAMPATTVQTVPLSIPQYPVSTVRQVTVPYTTGSLRPAYTTSSIRLVGNPVYRTAINPIIGSQVIQTF